MYWVKRNDDAECPYEVMDGQQRTLSLCEYVAGKFSYEFKNFFNQPKDIQQRILSYKLTVYICEGEPSEKLEWFKTINIAVKPLNEQEINKEQTTKSETEHWIWFRCFSVMDYLREEEK